MRTNGTTYNPHTVGAFRITCVATDDSAGCVYTAALARKPSSVNSVWVPLQDRNILFTLDSADPQSALIYAEEDALRIQQ